jgi:hypothetical protein
MTDDSPEARRFERISLTESAVSDTPGAADLKLEGTLEGGHSTVTVCLEPADLARLRELLAERTRSAALANMQYLADLPYGVFREALLVWSYEHPADAKRLLDLVTGRAQPAHATGEPSIRITRKQLIWALSALYGVGPSISFKLWELLSENRSLSAEDVHSMMRGETAGEH